LTDTKHRAASLRQQGSLFWDTVYIPHTHNFIHQSMADTK